VKIHRFKEDKESAPWGVSPDKDLEVKLTTSQYINYARGRRQRDLVSNRRPRRNATPAEAEKKADDKDKPKAAAESSFVDVQRDKALAVIKDELASAMARK
jgi:hypothetical protein